MAEGSGDMRMLCSDKAAYSAVVRVSDLCGLVAGEVRAFGCFSDFLAFFCMVSAMMKCQGIHLGKDS